MEPPQNLEKKQKELLASNNARATNILLNILANTTPSNIKIECPPKKVTVPC